MITKMKFENDKSCGNYVNLTKEFIIHYSTAMRMFRSGQGPSRASLKWKTSRGSRLWSSPRARKGYKKF